MRTSVKAMTVSTLLRGNEIGQDIPSYMPSIFTATRGHRGLQPDNGGCFRKWGRAADLCEQLRTEMWLGRRNPHPQGRYDLAAEGFHGRIHDYDPANPEIHRGAEGALQSPQSRLVEK